MHRSPFQLVWPAIFIILCSGAAFAQPKITVDRTEIPFGTLYNGSSREMSFTVTNTGTDTLRIYQVETSCGCTNVTNPKQKLAPGESQTLVILFNASGYIGQTKKAVDIRTNDPVMPNQRIVLVADVTEELQIAEKPRSIWLGEFKLGTKMSRDIAFINISNHPITIKSWNSSSYMLSIDLPKKTTVNPKQRIVIKLNADLNYSGLYSDYIYLQTDSEGQSTVPFAVSYSVIGQ